MNFLKWLLIVLLTLSCAPLDAQQTMRLDRNDLLAYRAADGSVRPVTSVSDWRLRREEIVRGMQEVMGPLPTEQEPVPLDVQLVEEADVGSYVRRLITYQSDADSRTPAYLCIPKDVLAGAQSPCGSLSASDRQYGRAPSRGWVRRTSRPEVRCRAQRNAATLRLPPPIRTWPTTGRTWKSWATPAGR